MPDDASMKYAIASHNIDFVTFLMYEYHIRIDLKECAKFNNLNAFFVHFDQTNDINDDGIPSLFELFKSQGSDINAKSITLGYSALHSTSKYNCIEESKLLISYGININAKDNQGKTPLIVASKSNHEEMVALLVSYGADVNEKDNTGQTALHYAAAIDNDKAIDILLSHDADINAEDNNGEKPALRLHKKLVHGFHAVSKYFHFWNPN
ncbi:ankyrin repeat protein, putative [Trichomonas vaginalis G3]|uniref:Ankyrin repeat protein, putative n=1 Tax=Trichomonas vaginalis (strain ATCC PRA-98 / G3) TaxID=412133 RepID=A2ED40_TRIV3|nr:calcium ion binding [Trichomonas vaginalis G3]EAY09395.1 ankyrin repeat protein, putative [Trichomonas vaginalis G3]KAI5536314.1 calcium ion binding [Trichomonas vaginalis G3]|eukprot:XP_001321618.1 ankyrin repeat protein [Trichomonas vaginalis G3]